MDITLKDVKKFFKENAEKDDIKTYLAEFKTDEDKIIEGYKKSQDFKSEIDRENTKAIKTYSEKTVPKLIEEEIKKKEAELELKYNPKIDPEIKALRDELKQEKEARLAEKAKADKQARLNFLYENVKPEFKAFVKLIDGSLEDDQTTVDYLNKTANDFRLLQQTTKPQQSDSSSKNQLTEEEYNALPRADRIKAEAEGKCDKILGRI